MEDLNKHVPSEQLGLNFKKAFTVLLRNCFAVVWRFFGFVFLLLLVNFPLN
jgi:hypothetical protein